MNDVGAILLTGLVGAGVAVWGIVSQRQISRRQATLEFIARSQADGDIIKARQTFVELAKSKDGLGPWSAEDKEKEPEVQSITLVLNEFELIAIGIQRGIVDFELYKRWLQAGTVSYWRRSVPFVHGLRQRTGNQMIFHEFEELARWMDQNQRPRRSFWKGWFFL